MGSVPGFFHRLGWIVLFPLVATGVLADFLLGDDKGIYSLGDALRGNLYWLILLSFPLWAPVLLLLWLFTGSWDARRG